MDPEMTEVTQDELGADLAGHLDRAVDEGAIYVVNRPGKAPAVLMSLQEFEGWRETVHLLSDPAEAAVLLESIRQIEAGQVERHDMDELHALAASRPKAAE